MVEQTSIRLRYLIGGRFLKRRELGLLCIKNRKKRFDRHVVWQEWFGFRHRRFSGQWNAKPIVRQSDVLGQLAMECHVVELVRKMSQISFLWS